MALRMGDAINPQNLPAGLDVYAGYTSGRWPDYQTIVNMFPGKKYLAVAVDASHQGDVLDIETGDATPADVPGWLARWKPINTALPILYCNLSTVDAVIAAAPARTQYLLWVAHYTDASHICQIADGTQWTTHNNAWDESLLGDHFFPVAPPVLGGEDVQAYFANNQHHVYTERVDGTVDHWWQDLRVTPAVWQHEALPVPH